MNEILDGTNIEYHECPDCNAALENNVRIAWEPAPARSRETHIPTAECALCGCDAGAAYGVKVAHDLLATVDIDPSEETKRSDTWQK